jgi:hypothetical protein
MKSSPGFKAGLFNGLDDTLSASSSFFQVGREAALVADGRGKAMPLIPF